MKKLSLAASLIVLSVCAPANAQIVGNPAVEQRSQEIFQEIQQKCRSVAQDKPPEIRVGYQTDILTLRAIDELNSWHLFGYKEVMQNTYGIRCDRVQQLNELLKKQQQ